MSLEDLVRQYQGHTVPQSYNATFIVLSVLVSFIGASSTLELINRRTGFHGLANHVLLVSSAITMGGVSIWSMHIVGNQAVKLLSGEPQLQIAYSASFTTLSFFVPILVLTAAFIALGSNDIVSWWRISIGGTLCGGAVCGMHYLGNASIANYSCTYQPANVVGAAIISVTASTVALSVFFIFRSIWANSWWKRMISGFGLAVAVSGMHWVAAVGTRYKMARVDIHPNDSARKGTVVVVICLSIGACLIILGSAILKARNLKHHSDKAQKVTLGAAVFDHQGRILVDTDGLIPSVVITNSYPEKDGQNFGIGHPAFHWMFQATRNWSLVTDLVAAMRDHLNQLSTSPRVDNGPPRVELVNGFGNPIEQCDIVFRELFCVASVTLAERFKEPVTSMGALWDEILPTGVEEKATKPPTSSPGEGGPVSSSTNEALDLSEKGQARYQQPNGRGSLMFLVRRVEAPKDMEKLTALGYRFANVHRVASVIESKMQIQQNSTEDKLRQMEAYTNTSDKLRQRVSICFFGVKTRANRSGFEVMVQKGARDQLPATNLPIDELESWHLDFIAPFANHSVSSILLALDNLEETTVSRKEKQFAALFADALRRLRNCVQDPVFNDAGLALQVVNWPIREQQSFGGKQLLIFRLLLPVTTVMAGPDYEFIPLSFFQVQHLSLQQKRDFAQTINHEFVPVLRSALEHGNELNARRAGEGARKAYQLKRLWGNQRQVFEGGSVLLFDNGIGTGPTSSHKWSRGSDNTTGTYPSDGESGTISQLLQTAKGWATNSSRNTDGTKPLGETPQAREIKVNIGSSRGGNGEAPRLNSHPSTHKMGKGGPRRPSRGISPDGYFEMSPVKRTNATTETVGDIDGPVRASGGATIIDVLFQQCVEARFVW